MLVAAAVCPCPPLLVPEVAAGAAPELDTARTACTDALGVLAAARPDLLVVLGPAEQSGRGTHPEGTAGSFRGFGVELDVRLGADKGADKGADQSADQGAVSGRELPPSLAVAAWLLERTGWADAPIEGLGVGEPLAADRCIEVGREIAARAERVALLVMGDASACRTLKSPGYLDERAAPFDAEVARALGAADVAALEALDAELAYELKVSGRAPWQVLAGAAEGAGLDGRLLYDDAPYGVGYVVATWS
ncbi:class III extradiol dioxygenase subunit B-like domain-containing protein [Streptomyces sp. NBC_00140]|uniref:class III extradiol dioxygenase subunit B-like domain-containing protein n=1 Tax=Streptomyces sp. NBC_00140 TaxID=2975664 RepID=UPI002251883A|nr:class III extradiol dioxygenase subunit B-like domain-containing protein [Streptomyces sp. NBC_00140]MCX5330904.1 class III extradiol dioxygenase subunit B-like domain-containing protein [Streptomyces sp. NBC_00140]